MNNGIAYEDYNADKLQNLLWEMSPDMLLIYSGDEVVYCNEAGSIMLESESSDDLIHKKFIRLVDSDYRKAYEDHAFIVTESSEEVFITLRFRKIWVEVKRSLIQFNGADSVLVYARNIDRLKEIEHAYETKKDQIKRMLLEQLTKREKNILDLYGDGKNRVAISRELDIEEGTVDRHTTNIKKKLKIKSMKELLNFAMDIKSS